MADERSLCPTAMRLRALSIPTIAQYLDVMKADGTGEELAAMVDVEPGAWFDPAFLQEIDAASTPVRVADGEQKVQNLQVQ